MSHTWNFVRAGGFDQVQITTGADLLALPELDQELWVALACPTSGIEFDARTLELLDLDKDKRIRAPVLIAAAKWACSILKNPDDLCVGAEGLELSCIDDGLDEGKLLLKTARSVLKSLGKADGSSLTVAEATAARDAFAKDPFNGDGIVPEASASDDATKALIRDVLACTPALEKDRSGAIGDYFARAKVAAYDARALNAVNGEEKQYLELAAKEARCPPCGVASRPTRRLRTEEAAVGCVRRSGARARHRAGVARGQARPVAAQRRSKYVGPRRARAGDDHRARRRGSGGARGGRGELRALTGGRLVLTRSRRLK